MQSIFLGLDDNILKIINIFDNAIKSIDDNGIINLAGTVLDENYVIIIKFN